MSTYKIGRNTYKKESHEQVTTEADSSWETQPYIGDRKGERLLPTDPTITRVIHNTGEYTAYVYNKIGGNWKCLYLDNSPH
jgi:hypothetical protein